jgi:regulator of sirC expression with transglutaminase-like and TPR domain
MTVIRDHLVHSFTHAALSSDPDLAMPALLIARVDQPTLDVRPYLSMLDTIGREACRRVLAVKAVATGDNDSPPNVDPDRYARIKVLNEYLFGELGFSGNIEQYTDPRNSFLNEVLDRRLGIPITLAVVYIEVARRAGLDVTGINFPGHFLLRCPSRPGLRFSEDLIIDPFHDGVLLSEDGCRALLQKHGDANTVLEPRLLAHATKPQILARMLLNLKRVYVGMHSFPQARDVTELLLAVDPTATNELRDRGLLAYHLNDYSSALRDLQNYLSRVPSDPGDEEQREDHAKIWEHVKSLRRRVATFN